MGKKKKVISFVMALCLLLTMPATAFAANTYTPYGESASIEVDGVTYYDPFGTEKRDMSEITSYLQKMFSSTSYGGINMFDRWGPIAETAAMNSDYYQGGLLYNMQTFYNNEILATIGSSTHSRSYEWDYSEPTIASSLAEVGNAVGTKAMGNTKMVDPNVNITYDNPYKDMTDTQPVIYQIRNLKSDSTLIAGDLVGGSPVELKTELDIGYALIFSDFEFVYLETGEELASSISGATSIEEALNMGKDGFSFSEGSGYVTYQTGMRNEAQTSANANQTIKNESKAVVTNTYNTASQKTITKTTGKTTTLSAKLSLLKAEFSAQHVMASNLTTVDVFTNSSGNTTTNEKTSTQESSVGLVLPAHTESIIEQKHDTSTMMLSYDYPVAISYKVRIMPYGFDFDLDDLTTPDKLSAEEITCFGRSYEEAIHGNAADNLYLRYQNRGTAGYETTYGTGLDWNAQSKWETDTEFSDKRNLTTVQNNKSLMENYGIGWPIVGVSNNRVSDIYNNRPMSVFGAQINIDTEVVQSKVYTINPIYPLTKITTNDVFEYNMTEGDSLYVDNIELNGYNSKGVEYFNFNKSNGSWILIDDNGKPVVDTDIASLEKDKIQQTTQLKANGKGELYLKYMIDEDAYFTMDGSNQVYATNAGIANPAVIKIKVSDAPFKGSIKVDVKDKMLGAVGDDPVNLDDSENIDVRVYDTSGKQVSRPVIWEVQALPSYGAEITNNTLTFSKEGTHYIRAVCGDEVSEWVEIQSGKARELSKIKISDAMSPAVLQGDISKGAVTIDLAELTVNAYDQYDDEWAGKADYEWTCEGDGASISGTSLTINKAGDFTISVLSDEVVSNTLDFSVTDSSKKSDEWQNPFIDVKSGDWFFNDVKSVCQDDLMNGTSATKFEPYAPASRGMIVTLLYRLEGSPVVSGKNTFKDLTKDWYRYPVYWASKVDIVKGYGNGLFGPDDNLTREQMVQIMYNYSKYKGKDVSASAGLNKYSDTAKISLWAHSAMRWAVAEGLIKGTTKGTLEPEKALTRAEAAAVFQRFMGN